MYTKIGRLSYNLPLYLCFECFNIL